MLGVLWPLSTESFTHSPRSPVLPARVEDRDNIVLKIQPNALFNRPTRKSSRARFEGRHGPAYFQFGSCLIVAVPRTWAEPT